MTITLKNVPRALHLALKRQAKQNKRSLNKEVISYLEDRTKEDIQRTKLLTDIIRARNKMDGSKLTNRPDLDPVKIIRALRDSR
jgi:hypothetical protein